MVAVRLLGSEANGGLHVRRASLILVTGSAFGPYVGVGVDIRTDQLVVYMLAVLVLPVALVTTRLGLHASAVTAIWGLYILVAATGLGAALNTSPWARGSALANLDNIALPMATFLLVSVLISGGDRAQARSDVAMTVALGAALSAVIGVWQYLRPGEAGFLSLFVGGGDTAERAATVGRFTGILGQPSTAGAVYSLGLFCAIYALRHRPLVQAIAVGVISVGGMLTLSKGFLLIGLPIGGWLLFRSAGHSGQRLVIVMSSIAVYATAAQLGFTSSWSGWASVRRLVPGLGDTDLTGYTGNRYGSQSSTQPVIDATLRDHPLTGYGLSGLSTPTDTLLVQALVLAGLVGTTCVVVAVWVIVHGYWRKREQFDVQTRLLFGAVVLSLVLLSLGSPALTANRASVLAWTLLALALADEAARGGGGLSARPAQRHRGLARLNTMSPRLRAQVASSRAQVHGDEANRDQ